MASDLQNSSKPVKFQDQRYTEYAPRLAAWRQECLARKHENRWNQDHILIRARSMKEAEPLPMQLRRGRCTRDVMASMEFALYDAALLMGALVPRAADSQSQEVQAARAYLNQWPLPGINGHCEIDLSRLFQLGVDGMRADLELRRNQAIEEKRDTYQSFLDVLEGFTLLCENAAATARGGMAAATPERQTELSAMAQSCQRIAHEPPASFRDALQLIHFATLGALADMVGLVGPGHIDRRVISFYQRDIEAGRLSETEALILLENLYVLINEVTGDGAAVAAMVGGRDAQGRDVTNPLSYLCLEALRRTKLGYPTVGVCWHEGTPEELVDLAVELIGNGNSNPALFGDEQIQRGLKLYGLPPEEACDYINSACVEITPFGSSNVWPASPYFPVCRFLLDDIFSLADGPPATFEGFLAIWKMHLALEVSKEVAALNQTRETRRINGGKPFQSLFTNDCIERGLDIDRGGARYNWVECSFVGLANLADSLYVIQEEVYNQRTMSLAEMRAILQDNFVGHEPERLRFLKKHPKYGMNDEKVDRFVREIVDFVTAECARYQMAPDGSPFIPGSFCWVMHQTLGRICGATPDGRKAGFPFADGAGPAQGRETCGPTAAILSTTSWDPSAMIGGVAFNMKFNSSLFTSPEAFRRLRDLLVTYLRRGGFEVQVNVVDHAILQKAKENPEAYRDLVVRIGGYTDYFTRIGPQMQAEVMLRTEYQGV